MSFINLVNADVAHGNTVFHADCLVVLDIGLLAVWRHFDCEALIFVLLLLL